MRKIFDVMKNFFTICVLCLTLSLSGEVKAVDDLMINGDLEIWNTGSAFPDGWGTLLYPANTQSNYSKKTEKAFSGTNALALVYTSSSNHCRFNSPAVTLEAGTYIVKSHMKGEATIRWVRLVKEGMSSLDTPGDEAILPQGSTIFPFTYDQQDWADMRLVFIVPQSKAGKYAVTYSVNKTVAPDHFMLDAVSIYKQPELEGNNWQSELLSVDTDGKLTYHQDEYGFTLPDFSHAGYRGGGVLIPQVPVVKEISPIPGDNTAHIQDAIDEVGKLSMDAKGIRGALLLKAGKYEIAGSLKILYSGVVLRGEGSGEDPTTSTIIYGTGTTRRRLIDMNGTKDGQWSTSITNKTNITDDRVVAGSKSFHVANASAYSVGDQIAIRHPSTQAWLDAVDGGVGPVVVAEWTTADALEIVYNRYVTDVDYNTNEITVEAPVFYTLDKSVSQSYIHKFSTSHIIKESGVEDLRLDTYYNPSVTTKRSSCETYCSDEQHANEALGTSNAENIWVRNVVAAHFCDMVFNIRYTTRSTIENCKAIDCVSVIEGGKRYNFNMHFGTQLVLFKNCYASYGRHHFVSNGTTSVSGNVIKDCVSEYSYATTEGHRRWTQGILFDNFIDRKTNSGVPLGFYNRGSYGTSHGWTMAHGVMWNTTVSDPNDLGGTCKGAALIVLQKPPTAQNYAIGCFAGQIDENGSFKGHFPGYIEGNNRPGLQPASLYNAQLNERLKNLSSDASLKMIYMGVTQNVAGTTYDPPKLRGFSSDVYEYDYTLSIEQKESPEISTETNHQGAHVYVFPAKNVTGSETDRTIIIQVVAENGSTQEYKILLTQYKGYINGIPVEAGTNKGGFVQASGIYTRNLESNHGDFYGDWGIRPHSTSETYVVTPTLDNGAGTLTIWVKQWNTTGSSTLRIQTATASAPDWVTRYNIPSSELKSSWQMKSCKLDINDPTIQVKFWIDRPTVTSGNRALNFYFDDIKITPYGENSSLGEMSLNDKIKIYILNKTLVIETEELLPYTVYDIAGQLSSQGEAFGKTTIPLTRKGVFIVKAGSVVKKIVAQ